MTQDYKENILKYITGNLEQQTGVYSPEYNHITSTDNDLYTELKTYFDSMITYTAFLPSKDNKNQDLEYSVLGCNGTLFDESDTSGAYVILDKNYDIVKVITHHKDGSLIGVIECLSVDEKGNYYGVEKVGSTYKIVELNNLVLKLSTQNDYEAVVINSYNIPNQYNWDNMIKIQRNANSNKYFILARRNSSGTHSLVGIELKIGDSLTWTYYTTTYDSWSSNIQNIFNNGYNAYWDSNDELQFHIAVNDYGLIMLSKGTGTTMVATRIMDDDLPNSSLNTFIFYSNAIGYYATVGDFDPQNEFSIYRIDLSTNTSNLIYRINSDYNSNNQMWLFKANNIIYFYRITNQGSTTYELEFGLIDDYGIYPQVLGTYMANTFTGVYSYANVITSFNKNYLYIQNQDKVFTCDFIWNSNNYNGSAFIGYGSLIPNVGTIENSNEDEILNKNLYNVSSYSNRYTATLQIPNYTLNNEEIYNALLYSKNNNILVNSTLDLTKNIYEELNINFTNEFNIIDNDNGGALNINASSYLTSSMLSQLSNAFIGKYRINYNDETIKTNTLSTNELVYQNLKTTYNIVIYVDKQIDSIDLLSDSEATVYKTIDCSALEVGKYYQITQDIKIGG